MDPTNQPITTNQPTVQPVDNPGFQSPPLTPAPVDNPGKTFGIISVVLGVLTMWLVGLPLAIMSLVKSKRAKVSALWGIIGVVVNSLALVVSVILAIVIVVAVANTDDNKSKSNNSLSSTNSESTGPNVSDLVDIPLSQQYKVTGQLGKAYWAVDVPKGTTWDMDVVDQGGKNHFIRSDKTAEFTTFQGADSTLSGASDLDSTRLGIISLTKGAVALKFNDESRTALIEMGRGKTVEFLVQDYTYTSSAGLDIKARMVGRAFDGGQYLYAWYASSSDTINESDWQMFIDGLSVNDGVY
jgi:hypothetical protein